MTAPTTTWQDVARWLWPEAHYIHGDGRFATVRGCGGLTVILHETEREARAAMQRIHPGPIRGCEQRHALVVLDE